MVVTRKAPVAPTVTGSRTSSTQAISRTAKGKDIVKTTEATPDYDAKKGKGKATKGKKRDGKSKKSKKRGFFDFLTNLVIAAVVIYALKVCPQHQSPEPTICRVISEYNRLVLEPYLIPYAQRALAHPTIAPYVETVTPYATRAIAIAKPIAFRAQSEFNTRVVPQWDHLVVPQWEKLVVPQYHAHVAPQLHKVEEQIQPYRALVESEYERYVGPYLRTAIVTLAKWERQTQPYVILAAKKSYEGYQTAKPYARPAWEHFKTFVLHFIELIGKYRRQFVDPHVAQMWVKINELSTGKKSIKNGAPTPAPTFSIQGTVVGDIFTEGATVETFSTPSVEATVTESAAIPSITDNAEILLRVEPGSPTTVDEAQPPSTIPEPEAVVPEETAFTPEETESPVLAEDIPVVIEATPSPIPTKTEDPVSTPTVEPPSDLPSPSTTGPSATPSASDDLDLDAFYAELGLDQSEPEEEEQTSFSAPSEETDAEREVRLAALQAAILEKRKDLTARHEKWEAQIDSLVVDQRKVLKTALNTLRKSAVAELNEHKEITKAVEGLVDIAEKYLKGAEGYLKNLDKDERKEDEKKALWARVVDKVDEKFTDRLQETEVIVNQWYGLVLEAELEEVKKATTPVLEIAEKAQADLGLDYAWLEDVTYQDWQRYHDLMRRYEAFREEGLMTQNGTHPSPLSNPVLPSIQDLRAEVEDIIVGFETRLRRIKRNGDRVFASIEDPQPEPEVSILPVVTEEQIVQEAVPPVLLGKSQEEVLQMLDNARIAAGTPQVPAHTASPQEDVDEIVREAESVVHHEEL